MTFEQLEYFIAVAEQDTFFDAAEQLHISQSSLSKHVMKLEKELGITLLDRSRRSASLTEAGQAFYREALVLHRQYTQSLSRMEQYKTPQGQKLRLGTLPILTQYHLTSRLRDFTEHYPNILFSIEEVEEPDLMKRLSENYYDVVIARKEMIDPDKYSQFVLTKDEMAVILPAGHRLADAATITLKDLQDETFILMNPYTSIYQLCIKEFDKSHIEPHIARTARVESIISAVAVGEGISLLPKSNFEVFHHKDIILRPLNPAIKLPVVLACKKTADKGNIKDFIGFLTSDL